MMEKLGGDCRRGRSEKRLLTCAMHLTRQFLFKMVVVGDVGGYQ